MYSDPNCMGGLGKYVYAEVFIITLIISGHCQREIDSFWHRVGEREQESSRNRMSGTVFRGSALVTQPRSSTVKSQFVCRRLRHQRTGDLILEMFATEASLIEEDEKTTITTTMAPTPPLGFCGFGHRTAQMMSAKIVWSK